ncbi:MAG: hypothetical protein ACTSO9_12670 [Candidatus Helarchaeota archaeon]
MTDELLFTYILAIISSVVIGVIICFEKIFLESKPVDYKTFEGELATVEIPFLKLEIGQVSIILKSTGERIEIPARAFNPNDPPFEKGDKVIIKKFDGSIAEITKSVNWELKKLKKGENKRSE